MIALHNVKYRLRQPLSPAEVLGEEPLTAHCAGEEIDAGNGRRQPSESGVHSSRANGLGITPGSAAGWGALILGILLWFGLLSRRSCATKIAASHPAIATTGNRRLRALSFCSLALMFGGCAWLLVARDLDQRPANVYDLGDVLLAGGPGYADGAIQLTSNPDHDREVKEVIPSCGCLKARVPTKVIRAGERVTVPVRLSVSGSGEKWASLGVVFSDGAHEVVNVRARGVPDRGSTKLSSAVMMMPNDGTARIVALVSRPKDSPPALAWRLPPSVTVANLRARYLPPVSDADAGEWEIATTFSRHSDEEYALLGVAVLEVDGAQAASAIMVGSRLPADQLLP